MRSLLKIACVMLLLIAHFSLHLPSNPTPKKSNVNQERGTTEVGVADGTVDKGSSPFSDSQMVQLWDQIQQVSGKCVSFKCTVIVCIITVAFPATVTNLCIDQTRAITSVPITDSLSSYCKYIYMPCTHVYRRPEWF